MHHADDHGKNIASCADAPARLLNVADAMASPRTTPKLDSTLTTTNGGTVVMSIRVKTILSGPTIALREDELAKLLEEGCCWYSLYVRADHPNKKRDVKKHRDS